MTTTASAILETWIAAEFGGHGVAVRREDGTPIPGEPLMSMDVAKDITRRAVAAFTTPRSATPESIVEVRSESLREAIGKASQIYTRMQEPA